MHQIMESHTPLNNYLSNYVIKLHIKLQYHAFEVIGCTDVWSTKPLV